MKISIVLPCYNEEKNIARIPTELIPELKKLDYDYEIVLVDDGSTDKSYEVAKGLGIPQLKIVQHSKNQGVGAAIRTAFQNLNSDLCVVLDTDFTFHPRYIKDLLLRFEKGDVDFVGGSPRLAHYSRKIPLWRVCISRSANIIYTLLFKRGITAASYFLRLYKTEDLKKLEIETNGFDISVEILFKLLLKGKRYAEIPATLTIRKFGESKLNYKTELMRHMALLFKIVGWRISDCFKNKKNRDKLFRVFFILAAILGSVIFVLTRLIILVKTGIAGEEYSFFSFLAPDALLDSVAMLRDVYDGKLWVSDGKIYEYMDAPSLWSFVTPYFMAPLLWVIRPLSLAFLSAHYIAGLGAFIIVYFLAKSLIKNRIFSLFFSLIFVSATLLPSFLLPISLENIKLVARTVFYIGSFPGEALLSKYNSTNIFPALIPFSLSFLFIYFSLIKKGYFYVILSGLSIALLIYLYITDAMYLLFGLGVMFFFFVFLKDFKKAKKIFWIVLITFLASSYYWFNFFAIRALPYSQDFYRRLGGEITHAFRWSSWLEYSAYIALAVIIWFWAKKKNKKDLAVYLIGWILAVIIGLNLQVVIGFNPTPSAWYVHQFYFGLALVYLVLIFWIYEYFSQKNRLLKISVSVLLIMLASSTIIRIIHTKVYMASYMHGYHIMPKIFSSSFDWINENIETDAVFVTPSLVSNYLLPSYTHTNILTPSAFSSPASQDEIFDRWLLTYKLFDVDSEYIRAAMKKKIGTVDDFALNVENGLESFVLGNFYYDNRLDVFKSSDTKRIPIPEDDLNQLILKYKNYPERLEYLLTKYKADYFYVGPYERIITKKNFDNVNYLERVYSHDGINIYKINKEQI